MPLSMGDPQMDATLDRIAWPLDAAGTLTSSSVVETFHRETSAVGGFGIEGAETKDFADRPNRRDVFDLPPNAGRWWIGHEQELADALRVAEAAAPHLRELAWFLLPRVSRWVMASSSIKGAGERAGSIGCRWPMR